MLLLKYYNKKHNITPTTIKKAIRDVITISGKSSDRDEITVDAESMSRAELEKEAAKLEKKMKKAAADLNFEEAIALRDRLQEIKQELLTYDE